MTDRTITKKDRREKEENVDPDEETDVFIVLVVAPRHLCRKDLAKKGIDGRE
jgi:hypothetical protein